MQCPPCSPVQVSSGGCPACGCSSFSDVPEPSSWVVLCSICNRKGPPAAAIGVPEFTLVTTVVAVAEVTYA